MKYLINLVLTCFALNASAAGLFYSDLEVASWKTRYAAFPKGNALHNNSGDPNRIKLLAAQFLKDPLPPVLTAPVVGKEMDQVGQPLVNAAFDALMTGNLVEVAKVRQFVLAQIAALPSFQGQTVNSINNDFGLPEYVFRLLLAVDYTKDFVAYTAADKVLINAWFLSAATYFKAKADNALNAQIASSRYQRSYTTQNRSLGWALQKFVNEKNVLTHATADGSAGNLIPYVGYIINNRVAMFTSASALIGLFLKNQSLVETGVLFCEEFSKFGQFADGTVGEYERDGSWCTPQQGLIYNAITLEQCTRLADAMARSGDDYLHRVETTFGLYGMEGGKKSLTSAINTHVSYMYGDTLNYSNFPTDAKCGVNCPAPVFTIDANYKPVTTQKVVPSPECKIDQKVEGFTLPTKSRDTIIEHHLWFQSYMRRTPNAKYTQALNNAGLLAFPAYGDKNYAIQSGGPYATPWGGGFGSFPELTFMYNVAAPSDVYPSKMRTQVILKTGSEGNNLVASASLIGDGLDIQSIELLENIATYTKAVAPLPSPKEDRITLSEKSLGVDTSAPFMFSAPTVPKAFIRGRVTYKDGVVRSALNDIVF
jgi:hypothetical protein